jgi:hypothetical protein
MQCVLYVHNHGEGSATDGGTARLPGRVCGMAVGEDPTVWHWDPARAITSFAEFRCDSDVEDPATLVQLAVGKAFARAGAVAPGRTIEFRGRQCSLRLGLEPGFDDPRRVLEPLLQLARGLRVRDGRLVSAPAPTVADGFADEARG